MPVREHLTDSLMVALLFSTYALILCYFMGVFNKYSRRIDWGIYGYSTEFILMMLLTLVLLFYGVLWAYLRRNFTISKGVLLLLSILPLLLLSLNPLPHAVADFI